jgi:LAO/AO transport system kinase
VVLIETIGVGQDQVAARDVAPVMLLVLAPHGGDEVQWQKAGIMECADMIAVNKADLGGAEAIARSLHGVTDVPAYAVSGETGQGVSELWSRIESFVTSGRS